MMHSWKQIFNEIGSPFQKKETEPEIKLYKNDIYDLFLIPWYMEQVRKIQP